MRERFDVETAAADDEREFAARMDFIDCAQRKLPKFFRIHLLQDRHRTDQMMLGLRQRSCVRFCGEKIETAIDLERVRADNFGADIARHVSSKLRFSRS